MLPSHRPLCWCSGGLLPRPAPDAMVFSARAGRAAGFFDGAWMNFRAL
ncbi:MAG: hypothetical protein Q8S73_25940 [Deltaproteobacteria bacterium]|nr:hypothetical protein [Myxococcales bacterium]MDP3217579.1 hypothetical protein [Deltaproteobacteria bacterium]